MEQAEVTKRVAEILDERPDAKPETIGRYLSICGDRPPRKQIAQAIAMFDAKL